MDKVTLLNNEEIAAVNGGNHPKVKAAIAIGCCPIRLVAIVAVPILIFSTGLYIARSLVECATEPGSASEVGECITDRLVVKPVSGVINFFRGALHI